MPEATDWYIYIVQCADLSLYTGITTDLLRRVEEHNSSPNGAKYTKARRPVRLVYFESSDSRSLASQREHALKQLSPSKKRQLVMDSTPACRQRFQQLHPGEEAFCPLELDN